MGQPPMQRRRHAETLRAREFVTRPNESRYIPKSWFCFFLRAINSRATSCTALFDQSTDVLLGLDQPVCRLSQFMPSARSSRLWSSPVRSCTLFGIPTLFLSPRLGHSAPLGFGLRDFSLSSCVSLLETKVQSRRGPRLHAIGGTVDTSKMCVET